MAEAAFGIEVPAGDPDALESAAAQLRGCAGALERVAFTVERAPDVARWTGVASLGHAGRCLQHSQAIGATGRAADLAAALLDDAADHLRAAIRATRRAIEAARLADDARTRARGAAETAAEEAGRARLDALELGRTAAIASAAGDPAPETELLRDQRLREADAADDRVATHRCAESNAEDHLDDARRDGRRAALDYEEHAEFAARRLAGIIDLLPAPLGAPGMPSGAAGGASMPSGWQHPLLTRIASRTPHRPPRPPLKVPDPGESPVDRLFGRDYVLPEVAASLVLEMGAGSILKGVIGSAKAGPPRTDLVPGGGLRVHEGPKLGHTLARHVGLSDDALRQRLARTKVPRASRFVNRSVAEDAISVTMDKNEATIAAFLRSKRPWLELEQEFDQVIGRSLNRGDELIEDVRRVRVVLVRDASEHGFHVKTAYPKP